MTSNVIPLRPPARARASAAWRRARVRCGLSQEPAALAVHRDPRTVRRREACDVDLGLLEAVLSHPKEMRELFQRTVGDDGPTPLNTYDGPVRVYACACSPSGQLLGCNT